MQTFLMVINSIAVCVHPIDADFIALSRLILTCEIHRFIIQGHTFSKTGINNSLSVAPVCVRRFQYCSIWMQAHCFYPHILSRWSNYTFHQHFTMSTSDQELFHSSIDWSWDGYKCITMKLLKIFSQIPLGLQCKSLNFFTSANFVDLSYCEQFISSPFTIAVPKRCMLHELYQKMTHPFRYNHGGFFQKFSCKWRPHQPNPIPPANTS